MPRGRRTRGEGAGGAVSPEMQDPNGTSKESSRRACRTRVQPSPETAVAIIFGRSTSEVGEQKPNMFASTKHFEAFHSKMAGML